jgi:hypothetical protein
VTLCIIIASINSLNCVANISFNMTLCIRIVGWTIMHHMYVPYMFRVAVQNCPFTGQPRGGRYSVVFVTTMMCSYRISAA